MSGCLVSCGDDHAVDDPATINGMAGSLAFADRELVEVDPEEYCSVSLTRFRIREPSEDDLRLLADLIRQPQYLGSGYEDLSEDRRQFWAELQAQHVASLGASRGVIVEKAAAEHGPYLLQRITAKSFRAADSETARAVLEAWVEAGGWKVPPPVQTALEDKVFSSLRAGPLYELPDLGLEAREKSRRFAPLPFHEFVSINRDTAELVLIIAGHD